jgi:hypothetical protein
MDRDSNLLLSSMRAFMVTSALENFIALVVKDLHDRGALDEETIAEFRGACIAHLKNSHATNLSLDAEARVFREASGDFEKLLDRALAAGRKWHQEAQRNSAAAKQEPGSDGAPGESPPASE